MTTLAELLRCHFDGVDFDPAAPGLGLGAFPEWDSFAHFNLFLLIEESYAIRFSLEEMSALKSLAEIDAALRTKGIVPD